MFQPFSSTSVWALAVAYLEQSICACTQPSLTRRPSQELFYHPGMPFCPLLIPWHRAHLPLCLLVFLMLSKYLLNCWCPKCFVYAFVLGIFASWYNGCVCACVSVCPCEFVCTLLYMYMSVSLCACVCLHVSLCVHACVYVYVMCTCMAVCVDHVWVYLYVCLVPSNCVSSIPVYPGIVNACYYIKLL